MKLTKIIISLLSIILAMSHNASADEQKQKVTNDVLSEPTVNTEPEAAMDWSDWHQDILTIDLYTLPLTPRQRSILANKIEQLKQDFGVGVVGDIERSISEIDASSLLNDVNNRPKPASSQELTKGSTFHDDLQLEEEILALEFANAKAFDDPEGLNVATPTNQLLFDAIYTKFLQLEQQRLKERLNNE